MLLAPRNIRSKHLVIVGHLVALLLTVSTCDLIRKDDGLSGVIHFTGTEFAGSARCSECHKEIADAHRLTPHYLTSGRADSSTVKGSFDSGENVLILGERLKVMMEGSAQGLFQRGFVDGSEVNAKPMELVIGSGRKGQSYLYWDDNALFQLPVSYYTADDRWSNSPGYPKDQLIFNRSISARCLECHSTYFKTGKVISGRETFDRNQAMLGVDCERCHGPAGDHVTFHRRNPDEKVGQNIVNPARLTRQQKLDNCALCHSGIRDNLMPSFSYTVGDNLEAFSFPSYSADSSGTLDVHGNQYGLLMASKCFKKSAMDCSTCHNVHVKETRQPEKFSARCMSCHSTEGEHFCKQTELPGLNLAENCIDCHMPELPSRQVILQPEDSSGTSQFFVRTHLIDTYEKNVKLFLAKLSSEKLPPGK